MPTFESILQLVGSLIAVSMFIPLVTFTAMYLLNSPWRANELGIALLFQKMALSAMVLVVVAGNFLPSEFDLLRYLFRLAAFVAILFFLWLDVVNLHRYQTGNKRLFFGWMRLDRNHRARK